MARRKPGMFDVFRGLWARGSIDATPPDHFKDCLNVKFDKGVSSRDPTTLFLNEVNNEKMFLYKPNPPYTGNNVPRIIVLKSNGDLRDVLLNTTIYSNVNMKSVGFVNFFGRAYISPGDGNTGLNGVNIKVYEGAGAVVRDIAAVAPTVPLTVTSAGATGHLGVGTYLISYAWETTTGFITRPAPFAGGDAFGDYAFNLSNIAVGPTGTVARWIITTKAHELTTLGPLGGPYDTAKAEFLPIFLAVRIADNTTTVLNNYGPFDESLVEEAGYLFALMSTVPAGLGLLDYNGRLVSYGEKNDPSLVRVSEIGEPESFSETSGFIITDPTDNAGVKNGVEFRGPLYIFKGTRGIVYEDNGLTASTWKPNNFEKAQGTSQYGIATILDAKGSSSEGFIIASIGALNYFNGVFSEPELSHKIRDLWLRINKNFFHLVQVYNDPINRRLYILLPLDSSNVINSFIFGDYRDGLDAFNIKWALWQFPQNVTSMLIYNDFTGGVPAITTVISSLVDIVKLNVGTQGNDRGGAINSFFQLTPLRFGLGVWQFNEIYIRAKGPCTLNFIAYGEDEQINVVPPSLTLTALPGREYSQLLNLISETCSLKVSSNQVDKFFNVDFIKIDGVLHSMERPRI